MNELKWMTEIAKESGRKHLPAFTSGIIKIVVEDDNAKAAVKAGEIVKIMTDMCVVIVDEAFPWDAMDVKKPSAPTESYEENPHLDCNINLSMVKSLVDFPLTERGPNCRECKCFDCGELTECHVVKPSTMHHCAYFCGGKLPIKACKYFDKENDQCE